MGVCVRACVRVCARVHMCSVTKSCPTLCNPVDSIARQAPLSMGFPRQEYLSGLPFPSLRDLPDSGIEPASPARAGDYLPMHHHLRGLLETTVSGLGLPWAA